MSYTVKHYPANGEQVKTIQEALDKAHDMGAGYHTMCCCVMTMTQESTCEEIDYGDRDSIGPYQQRSTWGSVDERLHAGTSTVLFLDGGHTGEPGFRAYYSIADGPPSYVPLDEACQKVQVSAFPYAYGQWQSEAEHTVTEYLASRPIPKTMHYERYPKKWRRVVKSYDKLRTKEHLGRMTRADKILFEHRRNQCRKYAVSTYRKAVREGSKNHPNWSVKEHRGWLEQQNLRRAKGLRCFPTE